MNGVMDSRYKDGYSVARATIRTAKILRSVGFAVATLIILVDVVMSLQGIFQSYVLATLPIIGAALTALLTLAVYTILAAQAQLIAAVLDTAINTSPIISIDKKAEMIEPLV